MAIKNERTIVGNVGKVYELRSVGKDNRSVVDFSVACTPRKRVPGTDNEWEDGVTLWSNCTAWGTLAENIAETWNPGDIVFVVGRAEMKDGYTNREGEEVPAREIVIAEFAGHENSRYPSTMDRGTPRSNNGPSKKASPAAKKASPKPVAPADDDLTIDEDDDDEQLPF